MHQENLWEHTQLQHSNSRKVCQLKGVLQPKLTTCKWPQKNPKVLAYNVDWTLFKDILYNHNEGGGGLAVGVPAYSYTWIKVKCQYKTSKKKLGRIQKLKIVLLFFFPY